MPNNESVLPISGRPIACPPRSPTPPPFIKSPSDSIIYGGFGKNWTLQKYRRYTEDQGFEWTSALHHQVLVLEKFMRDHLGYGYTDEEVTKRYTTSGIGYDCPPAFMVAFKRCETDYFYAEILDLIAKNYSLPKLLDVLKGGKTSSGFFVHDEQLANGRRAIRRLLAADVSDNALRHRIKKLSLERNWEVEKHLATPYTRGFLQDLDETARYGDLEWCRLNAAYAPKEMIEKSLSRLAHFRLNAAPRLANPGADLATSVPGPTRQDIVSNSYQPPVAQPMYDIFGTTDPTSAMPEYLSTMLTSGLQSADAYPMSGDVDATSYDPDCSGYDSMETQ